MLHFLLFVGVFQMINGQISSFLSLISQQHQPSFLSEMTGLPAAAAAAAVSLIGVLPATGKVV